MTLLKSRPKIGLKIARELRPGNTCLAVVVLTCKQPIEVEHVDVFLEGREQWIHGSGKHQKSAGRTFMSIGTRLSGARVLPAGTTELSVPFTLPADAPASLGGNIVYWMSVHVGIDWWPDAKQAFDIKVMPREVPSPPTEPRVFSSDPEGPRGKERHIELSLASTWVRIGGVVSGAFALTNLARDKQTSIAIGLRAEQTLYYPTRRFTSVAGRCYQIRGTVSEAREGEMVPFRFVLPADAQVGYSQLPRPDRLPGLTALSWMLEVRVGGGWDGDTILRVPFLVLPRSNRPGDAPLRIAPIAIGSDRLRALWEAVGAEHGLTYVEQSLRGVFGETELVIRRDHMGRDGVFLLAELTYPELFLELLVEPASAMRRLVGGDVRVGDGEWDRDHAVSARDAHQSASFLRGLVPAMDGAKLRRLDDRALVVELREPGHTRSRLAGFIAAARRLAERFEQLRRELPPPTGMERAVSGWRELAGKLGGSLETARMRIAGVVGPHAIEVRLALDADGRPDGTWLSVHPTSPIDDAHRFRWHANAGSASDAIATRFSGEIGQLAAILAHEARELRIEPERVAVCVPAVLGSTLPVEAAERRIERSVQLAALLRGQVGPYR